MTRILTACGAVLLLASCLSPRERFEADGARLVERVDAGIASGSAPAALEAAADCTAFLGALPAHPALDGLRARVLRARARSLRGAGRGDLARRDEETAARLEGTGLPPR